jgi:hypothetical protein
MTAATARLISAFGPLMPASVLSFSQRVNTLRAWRGSVRTDSPLVGRLVDMIHCTLVAPPRPMPSEPIVFAA